MMLRNSELSYQLVTVLLGLLDSTKFKQEKWSNLDQELEVWLLTYKPIMLVLSSLEMIGSFFDI